MRHRLGERTHADPNHVLFFEGHEEYRISHPVPGGDECTVFALGDGALQELLDSVALRGRRSELRHAGIPIDSSTFLTHQYLLTVMRRSSPADPLAVEELVLTLLRRSLEPLADGGDPAGEARRPGTRRHRRRAVRAVRAFLTDRLTGPVSLGEVAAEAGYSKFHLARVFRQAMGTSIHRYRNRLRLRTALELMADSKLDLSAVAFGVGFSSHSHFTEAFREEFGVTPSVVREAYRTAEIQDLRERFEE